MAKLSQSQRIKRLVTIGRLVAGKEAWQSALSRVTGVSQPMLGFIVNGDRELSPAIEERVAKGLKKEADKSIVKGAKMHMAAAEILESLE